MWKLWRKWAAVEILCCFETYGFGEFSWTIGWCEVMPANTRKPRSVAIANSDFPSLHQFLNAKNIPRSHFSLKIWLQESRWASLMPRWCPKWCLIWWNVWSSGASSSGCLLPCSVPGVESFWPWWFCSWPLASTTFFHPGRNKLPTKNTQRAAGKKWKKLCHRAALPFAPRCGSVSFSSKLFFLIILRWVATNKEVHTIIQNNDSFVGQYFFGGQIKKDRGL